MVDCNMRWPICPAGFDHSDGIPGKCWISNHTLHCNFDAIMMECSVYENTLYSLMIVMTAGTQIYLWIQWCQLKRRFINSESLNDITNV